MFLIDAYNLFVFDIFNFYNNQCPGYFNKVFCLVEYNGVAIHSCNKKLKLPFRKSKLGMQSLSYEGLAFGIKPWKPRKPC